MKYFDVDTAAKSVLSICLLMCIMAFAACNTSEQPLVASNNTGSSNQELLYPFVEFIAAESAYLDSTPLGIIKTITEDGKLVDSSLTDMAEVKKYAQLFSSVNPNIEALRPKYSEESFVDMTLGYNTFIITALTPDLPLQKATVLIHPETNAVERLIVQRYAVTDKDTAQMFMTWRKHKSLQVVENWPAHKKPATRIIHLKWSD